MIPQIYNDMNNKTFNILALKNNQKTQLKTIDNNNTHLSLKKYRLQQTKQQQT